MVIMEKKREREKGYSPWGTESDSPEQLNNNSKEMEREKKKCGLWERI